MLKLSNLQHLWSTEQLRGNSHLYKCIIFYLESSMFNCIWLRYIQENIKYENPNLQKKSMHVHQCLIFSNTVKNYDLLCYNACCLFVIRLSNP